MASPRLSSPRSALPKPPLSVDDQRQRYETLHDEGSRGGIEARRANYATMVTDYYDLVTDFYEFGWGASFHFAPRRRGGVGQAVDQAPRA